MRKHLLIKTFLLLALLPAACAGRQDKKPVPTTPREFPMVTVPTALTDVGLRAAWIADHYWDPFLNPAERYPGDSLYNGITARELEQQTGNFAYILQLVPVSKAREAVSALYDRLQAFEAEDSDRRLSGEMTRLLEKYLYDPNSPMRCEDAFNAFATRLAQDPRLGAEQQERYAYIARMSARNATGTQAADFSFVDLAGRRRRLSDIRAEHILLIFGNPDCQSCRELMEALGAEPAISERIRSGALRVLDIYIDEDIPAWKAAAADYPREWINGCDPEGLIRSDELYHVRAIPSLYLLDGQRTVLLKDAPQERVIAYLANQ